MGDKLENRTLYKKQNKIRFIRENYDTDATKETVGYFFQRCYMYENKLKTDISQFTKENFTFLYTNYFELATHKPLDSHLSYISKYQKWCSKELKSPIQYDINKLTEDDKEKLIVMPNYLSREELYNIIDNHKSNMRSKAVLFLVYEGIAGKRYNEITHLRIEDLKQNSIEIHGERSRLNFVPSKLIGVLNETNALTEMPKNIRGGIPKATKSNLYDNGYIIKNSHKSMKPLSGQRIVAMIHDILDDYYGKELKNPVSFIETSGKLDYFKRIRSELGLGTHEVSKSAYQNLCNRYGMNKSRWADFKRLINEIDDGIFVRNESEQKSIIQAIINHIPKDFTYDDMVDVDVEEIEDNLILNDNPLYEGNGFEKITEPYSEVNDINSIDVLAFLGNETGSNNLSTTKVTIERLIRASSLSNQIKIHYDYECQLCGRKLPTNSSKGHIAEAHHIRPYNKIHKGDDTIENMIVLCPNCHAQFDDLYYAINPENLTVYCKDKNDMYNLKYIELKPPHRLSKYYLEYTWNKFNEKT